MSKSVEAASTLVIPGIPAKSFSCGDAAKKERTGEGWANLHPASDSPGCDYLSLSVVTLVSLVSVVVFLVVPSGVVTLTSVLV